MSSTVGVRDTSVAMLPEEILEDILSRLPAKTLTRMKCVSKASLALISSREFAKIHLRRTIDGTPSIRVLTTCPFKSVGCDGIRDLHPPFGIADHEMVNLLTSHDGLMVLRVVKGVVLTGDGDIYLWNPTTGSCRRLLMTASHLSWCFYELGYDSKIDDCKILRHDCYFEADNDIRFVYEVFPLSVNSWRQVLNVSLTGVPYGRGVFLNKCIHWLYTTGQIVTFDLKNEKFGILIYSAISLIISHK